jgi:hypothetical protein
MKPHHCLVQFNTQVGFRSVAVMKQTVMKSPNLNRLETFGFDIQEEMELDEMFDVLLESS